MIQAKYNSDALQVAVLTVHVKPEMVEQIRQAAADMPWATVAANFENYFSAAKRPHFTQQTIGSQACIAVIDFDGDLEPALETAEFLRQSFSHKIAIIGLSSGTDPDLLLHAMRAGCSEFVSQPFDPMQFTDALTRLDQRWSTTIAKQQNSGKILSFFGAKGGVGTTTLAVHLAIFLVSVCRKRVLLIDNHAQLGHVCLYLGLDGNRYHFNELIRNVNRLDHDLLRGFIARHSSGLDVLSSPDVHGNVSNTDAESIGRTLGFLSAEYDFVLLDCEASLDEVNLAVIDISNYVYLVSTPEIGSIRDLSRYVDGIIQHELATDKLQVVINRHSTREAISIEQIEKAVRLPVAIRIASHYKELVRFITMGEPMPPDSKSDFSLQLMKWAKALAGAAEAMVPLPAKKRFALWK